MKAIRFVRSVPRWLLVRLLGKRLRGLATGPFSCLELAELEAPRAPGPEWVRVRPVLSGICGSDLSAIACRGSPYFSPFVSTPFVLGHEVAGRIEATGPRTPPEWKVGQRVVLEPALGCAVRGIEPPCEPCAQGQYARCVNILKGDIAAGFQTGYCASTGGGWSQALVAHPSQLHAVPDDLPDEAAVLAEPFACALHGVLKAMSQTASENQASTASAARPAPLLVIGCGAMGLLSIAAYRALGGKGPLLAAARYAHQAEMAQRLGADEVCRERGTEAFYRWVLARTGGSLHQPELGKPVLLGGPKTVLDCVGSSQSMDDALRLAAPGGQVLLVGMPGIPKGVDATALWYKELRLHGTYAYGWEEFPAEENGAPREEEQDEKSRTRKGTRRVKTFTLALELLRNGRAGPLAELVNRKHPLENYRAALDDAFHAGQGGAFKVVFELDHD